MTNSRVLAALTFVFVLSVTPSFAEFSIPHYVYGIDGIDQAKRMAIMYGHPIAFVYTNKDTSCGLAASASIDAFKELRKVATIIYACSGKEQNDWIHIPKIVKQAINSPDSGRFIPKTIIVDSDLSKVILMIPYERSPEKRISLLKKAVEQLKNEY